MKQILDRLPIYYTTIHRIIIQTTLFFISKKNFSMTPYCLSISLIFNLFGRGRTLIKRHGQDLYPYSIGITTTQRLI